MRDLKTIRRRIGSVRSTQKITRAMEMVAAAKLRRAQEELFAIRPYTREMADLLARLAASSSDEHPLLTPRPKQKVFLLVITSDRGLCGGFNGNAVARAREQYRALGEQQRQPSLLLMGRKARDVLRRDPVPVLRSFELPDPPSIPSAREVAQFLTSAYLQEEADACVLVFNRFISTAQQQVVLEQLLPVEDPRGSCAGPGGAAPPPLSAIEFRYEPDPATLLSELLPMYVEARLLWALLESRAAEQGARMAAMQGANRNAEEMIQSLTLEYNKARQASITRELMEIVAGAEAQR